VGDGDYTLDELEDMNLGVYDATSSEGPMVKSHTNYIGIKWCFGEFGTNYTTCNGHGDEENNWYNDTQDEGVTTDLRLTAVQSRNNGDFVCHIDGEE